jgi:hypothetical protein
MIQGNPLLRLSKARIAKVFREIPANPLKGISLALATTIGAALAWSYTEFIKPSIAPVNVSVDLSVKRDSATKDDLLVPLTSPESQPERGKESNKVTPIMIDLEIQSKSQHRNIDVFNSIFVIYGMNVVPDSRSIQEKVKPDSIEDFFHRNVADHEKPMSIGLRRVKNLLVASELLSYGSLFGSTIMEPGEKLQANRIVPIPYRQYDFVQVRVYVPTGLRPSGLGAFVSSLLPKSTPGLVRSSPEQDVSSVSEKSLRKAPSGTGSSFADNEITVDYELVRKDGKTMIRSYFCSAENSSPAFNSALDDSQPCGNISNVASREAISRLDLQSKILVKELWLDNDKN